MEEKLNEYQNAGFLHTQVVEGTEVLCLATPCQFRIIEDVVTNLKTHYQPHEEIGGVLWAKPTFQNGKILHIVDKVSYVRNGIEDKPNSENKDKSNAYRADNKESDQVLDEVFSEGYLPIRFHTHPVKGTDFLQSLTYSHLLAETSEQDKKESNTPHPIGGKRIIMPRGLIVGNDMLSDDIFIGLYNGLIAPLEFKDSKAKVQEENINKIVKAVSLPKLTDGVLIGLVLGAILLLYVIAKYPKQSLSVIAGLSTALPILLSNTDTIDNPDYFNRLSFGDAIINIPKTT